MSWQDVRLYQEQYRQRLWGTLVTGRLATVPCEATGPESTKPLQRNDVMPHKPVIITVTNSDFLLMGSPTMRDEITWEGNTTLLIYGVTDDPRDATVDFRCFLKT